LNPSFCIPTTGYVFFFFFFFTPLSPTRNMNLHSTHPPTTTSLTPQLRARNTNPQATKKVRDQIEECKTELSLSTKPYDSHNPRVIAEYLEAGDEERSSFQQIFGACKLLMQLQSKGRWYSWKRGLIERLGPDVEGILDEVVDVSHPSIEGSSEHGNWI
jgi:hypothetical protein